MVLIQMRSPRNNFNKHQKNITKKILNESGPTLTG